MDQQPKIREQRKRLYKNYIIVLVVIVVVISGSVYLTKLELFHKGNFTKTLSCQTVEYAGDFTIKLKSRQFLPEAEISSGLNWLSSYSGEKAHVLLQLCEPLNPPTKILLEKSGIQLLNYIPANSWFASIPKNLKQDDPALAMVRWFGPILPEDKVESHLFRGEVGSWALREGNKVALEISFFEDVNLDDARQIIRGFGGEITGSTPISNELTVEIPKDTIQRLTEQDSVRWIDTVPPPPTT